MATLKYKDSNGNYQPIVGLNVQYPRQEYVTVDAYSNLPEVMQKGWEMAWNGVILG